MARVLDSSPVVVPIDPKDPLFRSRLVRELRRPITPAKLAAKLGVLVSDVGNTLEDLEGSGYIILRVGNSVSIGTSVQQSCDHVVQANHFIGKPLSFGVVADMHLCSTSERLDVLEAAYDEFAHRKINTVLCPGNYVDGECRYNAHELKAHGVADQCYYALDHWPQRKGIKTYYVDGDDHEGWFQQREGIEFGRFLHLEALARGRKDLTYLGYMEADFELKAPGGSSVVKLIHAGGGSSYAYSYSSQKLAESFQGGEKPAVAIIGHYHKQEYCFPRNVHCIQSGCCQDQTRFMRKRKLAAHVGFAVITLQQDTKGSISRFGVEFFPFWDRGYYLSRDGQALATRLQSRDR
jgi:predicted phosphodiesterase